MSLKDKLRSFFSKHSYLSPDGSFHVRKLLFRTFIAMLCIFGLYFLAIKYYEMSGLDNSVVVKHFVSNFGVQGVALYVFIVDLFVLPLSVDFIWPFVIDWNPLLVIVVMGTSSVAGAFCAYLLGRLVGFIPSIRHWVLKQSGTHTEKLITRYGIGAILVSGLTPLPFSTICTVAGVLELKAHHVLLATMVRYVRMGIYYLIFAGLIKLG